MQHGRSKGSPRSFPRTTTSTALAGLLAAAAAVSGSTLVAPPAHAAGSALTCIDRLYLADGTSGNALPVDPATGAVGAAAYDATPAGGSPNQLGVGRAGVRGINTVGTTIVQYDAASGTTTTATATQPGANSVAGAIDPKSRLFYYGGYTGSKLLLSVYDPTTRTTTGPVASISTDTVAPGSNGDLAFDADGTLYFVAASSESTTGANDGQTTLYRLDAQLPTSGPQRSFTATELSRTTGLAAASNGIAFASDGYLYLGRSTALTKVNPITGASLNTVPMSGVASTDLASCAGPSTLTVAADLGDGRAKPTDQFTIDVTGGDYDGTPAFPRGTTTGTEPGVQDQDPGETAGKAIVLPGETYTATLGAAGTTDLDDYFTGYTCIDTATGDAVATGTDTTTMPVTVPTGTTGATTSCSFVIEAVRPQVTIDSTVAPGAFTTRGQQLDWTYGITNTGNVTLDHLSLSHTLGELSATTCNPSLGDPLPAGATITCTASSVVSAGDVAAGHDLVDDATVTGAPTKGSGTAADHDAATAAYGIVGPHASADAKGTPFDHPVTLAGATDDTAGTSPLTAGATVLVDPDAAPDGHSLATPQGTWTVEADGSITFEPATGFVGTASVDYRITDENGLTDTATATVSVRPGPTAADDTATTRQNVAVDVDLLTDDVAGPKGDGTRGALDPGSVTLRDTGLPTGSTVSPDGRVVTVPGEGEHTVDPAIGQVRFDPEPGFTGSTSPVTYTVTDQAGNSATASYRVTVTPVVPVVVDDAAKTPAGQSITVPVLSNDVPGDATAPLEPGSVRFTSPDATGSGTRLVVSGEGVWSIGADGSVTFAPEDGFHGTTTAVGYAVSDENGTTGTGRITVVVGADALATPDHASTPQGRPVTLDPLTNDVAGDSGTPCVPAGSNTPAGCDTGTLDRTSVGFPTAGQPAGSTRAADGRRLTVPGEGEWSVDPVTGDVTLAPAPGFHGTTTAVAYAVDDSLGNTARSTITVTVRAIAPVATDDRRQTTYATSVTLPGARNDAPGTDDNGTAGDTSDDVTPALVPSATVFPTSGQPRGATVSASGKTLTVKGEGSWAIAADGSIVFTPAEGFSGTSSPVAYRIEDANGASAVATLTVVVQPGPVAAVDRATTAQDVDVTLHPLRNDTPGLSADGSGGSWDVGSVRLRTAAALPAGSTLSADGKTLTVPGEGRWMVRADGSIVFDPESTFVGTTTPAPYAVTDAVGNTAVASLAVTVTPNPARPTDGGAAGSSSQTTSGDAVTVDVLANVDPATGAHLLTGSVCLLTGTVTVDGKAHPVDGGGDCAHELTVDGVGTWTVNADGTVTFAPADGFTGKATIRFRVRDSAGNTYTAPVTVKVRATGGVLASTGGPALSLLLGGGALIAAGAWLLWRRRVVTARP